MKHRLIASELNLQREANLDVNIFKTFSLLNGVKVSTQGFS